MQKVTLLNYNLRTRPVCDDVPHHSFSFCWGFLYNTWTITRGHVHAMSIAYKHSRCSSKKHQNIYAHTQEHMHMYEHMHMHIVRMISHYITDFLLLSNLSRHRCHLLQSTKHHQCIRLTAALAHRRLGRLWIGKLCPRTPPHLLTFTFARRSQVYYLCFVSFECACTYLCACVHMHVHVLVRVCARACDWHHFFLICPTFLTYTINSACWRRLWLPSGHLRSHTVADVQSEHSALCGAPHLAGHSRWYVNLYCAWRAFNFEQ